MSSPPYEDKLGEVEYSEKIDEAGLGSRSTTASEILVYVRAQQY